MRLLLFLILCLGPVHAQEILLPEGAEWKFTRTLPAGSWETTGYDDALWESGKSGFGNGGPFPAQVKTTWSSGQLWLRGSLDLTTIPRQPQVLLTHRADVAIRINGYLVANVMGETPGEVPVPIQGEALASLKAGKNLITAEATCIGGDPFLGIRIGTAAPSGATQAPLFRDPRFDGAADPMVVWNREEKCWTMFYTQRRANLKYLPRVGYCYGTDIGMAVSKDGGRTWTYAGTAAGLETRGGKNTWWAPEVVWIEGQYHMWVSYIEGVHNDWTGVATMLHYTSPDLRLWTFSDPLPMHNVIDASLFPLPSGGWRMFYKQDSKTRMTDSTDLKNWNERGIAAEDAGQEGPNVFRWKDRYWMIADVWHGQQVYQSADLTKWTLQEGGTILGNPGKRRDDATFGRHADVLVQGDRAFVIYFTHPGGDKDHERASSLKRTSVQVAELEIRDGKITCDRDKELDYTWDAKLTDW